MVTLVARPLLTPVAQKLCNAMMVCLRTELCSFSNITSHQNRLLLFVKHLAMDILTMKYRIKQLYTDW
jgi:hypothetical protein